MVAGDVKVGLIYKDELAERRMKGGDVFRIPAGSVFYMVNVGEGQRLQIICSIDKSESLSYGSFQVITQFGDDGVGTNYESDVGNGNLILLSLF